MKLIAAGQSKQSPLMELLTVAGPSVATMASYTAMQFVDAIMVSRIEPANAVYVAAQGNGGIAAWIPVSFMAGLVSAVSTYVSQNLGAGRPERAPAYAWNALYLCVIAAAGLIPILVVLPHIFAIPQMGHTAELQELEVEYARILLGAAFFTMASKAISQYFFGLHRARVVLAGALAGNAVNVLANWVFIFGHWGASAYGVSGAAIGTVIGTVVEFAVPFAIFVGPKSNREVKSRSAMRPSRRCMAEIWKVGWPGSLMWCNEIVCWGVFMTALAGHFGKAHNAAGWIALRYMQIAFLPAVGMSNATAAVVGRLIGAGRHDDAAHRAWLAVKITMAYMGLCAVAFVAFREPAIALFIDDDVPEFEAREQIAIGARVMIVAAVFQIFDALGITLSGALRGAGDTLWPGVATVILAWVFIIGLGGCFVLWVPEWGSIGPWLGAAAYIIALGLFLAFRFRSGQWRRIELLKAA